jgi:WD40 repeat protein
MIVTALRNVAIVLSLFAAMVFFPRSGPNPVLAEKANRGKKAVLVQAPPQYGISFVTFSPDSKLVAYNLGYNPGQSDPEMRKGDNAIMLCEAASGKTVGRLVGQKYAAPVAAIFSPDGKQVAVINNGSSVSLWDLRKGKKLHGLEGSRRPLRPFAFSPDGKFLAGMRSNLGEVGGPDYKLYLWDTATGKKIRGLGHGPFGRVEAFAFGADGKLLLAEHYLLVRDSTEKDKPRQLTYKISTHAWSVPTGEHLGQVHQPRMWKGDILAGRNLRALGAVPGDFRVRFLTRNKVLVLPGYRSNPMVAWSRQGGKGLEGASKKGRGPLYLVEAASGKVLHEFKEFQKGAILSVALSPDGNLLAAAGQIRIGRSEKMAVIWDVSDWNEVAKKKAAALSRERLVNFWPDLASDDGFQAHRAMFTLRAAPKKAVPFLEQRMGPVIRVEQIPQLIADLESRSFKTRQRATQELERLEHLAKPALEKVLSGKPSAETRRQVEGLLKRFKSQPLAPEVMRDLRGIDILECIGTSEAATVLQKLAKGAPEALQTREAKAALKRLREKKR